MADWHTLAEPSKKTASDGFDGTSTLILKAFSIDSGAGELSVTRTVKLKSPAAVMTPEIVPSAVRTMPSGRGSLPAASAQA